MYPNGKNVKFDSAYYINNHLPMVIRTLGDALKGLELDLGMASRIPGQPAPFVAIAHLKFEDLDTFKTSFEPHAPLLAADVKNFSNVQGELQISELITL